MALTRASSRENPLNPDCLDILRRGSRFMLTGHESPDGDCLGSQVGMHELLTSMGKDVVIRNPDRMAAHYDFLGDLAPLRAFDPQLADDAETDTAGGLPEVDVAILLDCAQMSRLGPLGPELTARREAGRLKTLIVDHHVGSEVSPAGDSHFVNVSAAATGGMVYDLHKALDVEVSLAAATGIFVALVSDTGWFRYSNTDASVMAVAAELLAVGIDPSRIYDLLHRRESPESVGILGDVLSKVEMRLDGRMGLIPMDKRLTDRAVQANFDTDQVMEPVRSIGQVEAVALLKERFDGMLKVSLRSTGDLDVQKIAQELGGGGHVKAAGATTSLSLAECANRIEGLIEAALRGAAPAGGDFGA